jgi:hypothetical protein
MGTACQTVTYGKRVYSNGVEVGVIDTRVEREGSDCHASQPRQAVGSAGGGGRSAQRREPPKPPKRIQAVCPDASNGFTCRVVNGRVYIEPTRPDKGVNEDKVFDWAECLAAIGLTVITAAGAETGVAIPGTVFAGTLAVTACRRASK